VTTVAAKFSGTTTKFNAGAAALAITAAAVLTPPVVANAEPAVQTHFAQALGSAAAVDDELWFQENGPSASTSAAAATPAAGVTSAPSFNSIFQNRLIWIGPSNPNPPAGTTTVFEFRPLALVPGFLRPLYRWFTQRLDFQLCVAGASVKVGPYGTVSGSVSSSGC
jgi:hypothetical protein